MIEPHADRRVILASASPARRQLLINAGIVPEIIVSGVDEDSMVDALPPSDRTSASIAAHLARAKARDVAERQHDRPAAVVIGCDSVLELHGHTWGKPSDADEAVRRWHLMRGHEGLLITGHAVVDVATGAVAEGIASTVVRFGQPTDQEVAAYVATGEPLGVAGAFTLDGLSAPFIDGIDGDPSNVIGLSLPLLRRLMLELGVAWTELWSSIE